MNKVAFQELVINVTNAFRCGYEGEGNALLAKLFEQMASLSSVLSDDDMVFVQSVLPVLADAQQRGDMIYLSDILQYEILPRVVTEERKTG